MLILNKQNYIQKVLQNKKHYPDFLNSFFTNSDLLAGLKSKKSSRFWQKDSVN